MKEIPAMRRTLTLAAEDRTALTDLAKRGLPAYLRERAAAMLKIADHQSPHAVALHGLLLPRDPDTVYAWLDAYQEHGIAGLRMQPGRGRHPAFSPSAAGRGG